VDNRFSDKITPKITMDQTSYAHHRHLQIRLAGVNDRLMTPKSGSIHIGIGGWTFEPWRGVFYPEGLPHAQELGYASAHLTSIEVNGTFFINLGLF
jgi:hypothetical protein